MPTIIFDLWGVKMTGMEEMRFGKYCQNPDNKVPAMNTIPHEKRVQILENWLREYRGKDDNQKKFERSLELDKIKQEKLRQKYPNAF